MPKKSGGYPGRGAAGTPSSSTSKKSRAKGYDGAKSGTLAGSNTNVKPNNEMRSDTTHGIMHANPFPKGMGGGHGPGRS